jgi:uncharacterized protein (TIGR02594 family)
MQQIIDVDSDVSDFASGLANLGVKTVIRYYNNNNTASHPTKCLTRPELKAWHDAGLSVAVVFEQRGGAAGDITDLTKETGTRDAQQALHLATGLEQPEGSAIYFAVDFDFIKSSDLQQITDYFREVRRVLANKYLVGVYGSGMVGRILKTSSLVDHIWLTASTGFSGTKQALEEGNFTLFQRDFDKPSPIGGFKFDGNILNSSFESFGQFVAGSVQPTPRGVGAAALFKVIAASSLNLRAGPGNDFPILKTVPAETIVTGIGRDGGWIKVDLAGDGHADGFMFEHFLQAVSGGLPLDPGSGGPPLETSQPIDVARAEMNRSDVFEVPGLENNPRILLYNSTTDGRPETDHTPWCSSFVNYCVEQVPAVRPGTHSKAAKSWHTLPWRHDVTTAPKEGDIVVFERRRGRSDGAVLGGHVGFFISQDEAHIQVLGGNQGKRISVASFPKDDVLDGTYFKLLSIRRH